MKLRMTLDRGRVLPLALTGIVVLIDQLTKAFIAANWPSNTLVADVFNNGFLQIYHVRNKAIAFSLGHNLAESAKPFLFILLPVVVLCVLVWYYLSSDDFTRLQRWATAGILGGGIGNILDRVFRPEGVVDFISVKFYGILGFDRWPTFNVADSSVVVCCLLLFVSIIVSSVKPKEKEA